MLPFLLEKGGECVAEKKAGWGVLLGLGASTSIFAQSELVGSKEAGGLVSEKMIIQ